MEKLIFTKDILNSDKSGLNPIYIKLIYSDTTLLGNVAVALGITPGTLYHVLRRNDKKLTQAKVLELIEDHLKVQDTAA